MLLNDENIRTLTEIVQEYWWALVLGLLGLLGFMSIFVKICSVHTPSSNPRFKPARSFSFTHVPHDSRHRGQRIPRQLTSPSRQNATELSSSQQQSKADVLEASSSNKKDNVSRV
ncbi:unnamed protein product [Rotaria socialis]|nr:unnamed protein product [Rotaria socialis]